MRLSLKNRRWSSQRDDRSARSGKHREATRRELPTPQQFVGHETGKHSRVYIQQELPQWVQQYVVPHLRHMCGRRLSRAAVSCGGGGRPERQHPCAGDLSNLTGFGWLPEKPIGRWGTPAAPQRSRPTCFVNRVHGSARQ